MSVPRNLRVALGGLPRSALLSIIWLTVVICVFGIGSLALDVNRKIQALATASSDNIQWTISQVDVEFLTLAKAVADNAAGTGSVAEVKRRFDVFYSRMNLVSASELFAPLREEPKVQAASNELWGFLNRFASIIDGPEIALEASLPVIDQELGRLREASRTISLSGLEVFAHRADAEREGIVLTMRYLAYMTALLVALLVGFVVLLLWFDRANRLVVRENLLSLRRQEAIIATSLDAIIVADTKGTVLAFNGAAEDIFGYLRSEMVGQDLAELVIPEHLRAAHRAGMKRYLAGGDAHVTGQGRIRLEALRKSGEVFPAELTLSSAESDRGEIFICFLRDLSLQVAAERELLDARDKALAGERAKADLLAVMSHEMRTPLHGLLGTLELLQDSDLKPPQRELIRVAESSGHLLLHHVNDVLDISRLESGKMPIESHPVNLRALVEETLDSQRVVAQANQNRLRMQLPPENQCYVLSDPTRLRQILLNLVGNANKFTRNGEIFVEVEHLDNSNLTELRVTDTGIGIKPEDLERIFEDFVTLDASYSRKSGGTGLGLSITRRLAAAMGGEIGAQSDLGQGSMFWVRLPFERVADADLPSILAMPTVAAEVDEQSPTKAALDVLIVEDNPINRMLLRTNLQKLGHKVTEAQDGEEGVHAADGHHFDLILMDISMPVKDGMQATKEIRAGRGASADVPIVAVTALAMHDERQRFRAAGMTDVLIKPLSRDGLQEMITKVMAATPLAITETLPEPQGEPAGAKADERPLVLHEVLIALREDLGAETLEDLMKSFAESAHLAMSQIAEPDRQPLASETIRIVHSLAGSAGVFGAAALRQKLATLETSLKRGEASALAEAMAPLKKTLGATLQELEIYGAQGGDAAV